MNILDYSIWKNRYSTRGITAEHLRYSWCNWDSVPASAWSYLGTTIGPRERIFFAWQGHLVETWGEYLSGSPIDFLFSDVMFTTDTRLIIYKRDLFRALGVSILKSQVTSVSVKKALFSENRTITIDAIGMRRVFSNARCGDLANDLLSNDCISSFDESLLKLGLTFEEWLEVRTKPSQFAGSPLPTTSSPEVRPSPTSTFASPSEGVAPSRNSVDAASTVATASDFATPARSAPSCVPHASIDFSKGLEFLGETKPPGKIWAGEFTRDGRAFVASGTRRVFIVSTADRDLSASVETGVPYQPFVCVTPEGRLILPHEGPSLRSVPLPSAFRPHSRTSSLNDAKVDCVGGSADTDTLISAASNMGERGYGKWWQRAIAVSAAWWTGLETTRVACSRSGLNFASINVKNVIRIWDSHPFRERVGFRGYVKSAGTSGELDLPHCQFMGFSHDDRLLYLVLTDQIWIVDANSGEKLQEVNLPTLAGALGGDLSPNGGRLAVALNGKVCVWDFAACSQIGMLNHANVYYMFNTRVKFSSCGCWIFTFGGAEMKVWDAAKFSEVASFAIPSGIGDMILSPDGRTLAFLKKSSISWHRLPAPTGVQTQL